MNAIPDVGIAIWIFEFFLRPNEQKSRSFAKIASFGENPEFRRNFFGGVGDCTAVRMQFQMLGLQFGFLKAILDPTNENLKVSLKFRISGKPEFQRIFLVVLGIAQWCECNSRCWDCNLVF